ncbi:Structure-specific endonuclease subunit SLX4 [Taenia crassiceps]|uniref:Structure-specific endonuclease subunit SLX4 n=1 Tax=Taenia crassiceps TaxID=6207 RepID=A0ABR4QTU9_9CEST
MTLLADGDSYGGTVATGVSYNTCRRGFAAVPFPPPETIPMRALCAVSNPSVDISMRAGGLTRPKGKSSYMPRIGKTKGNCGKVCVPSIDHLLIAVELRRVIFLDRLARILNDSTVCDPIRHISSNNVLSSDLWELAALSSNVESVSDQTRFYVASLSAHISPAQRTLDFSRFHLSQILGRGSSQQTTGFFAPSRNMMERGMVGDGKPFFLEMLSRMVDSPICSDLSIYLDSGVHVFAHRFILATWNPELFLLEENTNSISAPGISKDALLGLLRALYTFDLSFLSSLSPEVEFTLDCWQMLDAVRNRIKSNITGGSVDNPVVNSRRGSNSLNIPEPIVTPSEKMKTGSLVVGGSDSSVDLFASTADSSTLIGTPWNPLEHNAVAVSYSTPHPHPSSDVILEPIGKSLGLCPTSENAIKNNTDPEKLCHSPRNSVELDVDPPAFSEEYVASLTSTSPPSLPFLGQRATEKPNDVGHTPMRITSPSLRDVTSDHCFFFDGSVPTPAPLAKRLRASADSVEGVDTVFSSSSQPVEISSVKDDIESGNSNADDDNDDCQMLASFSQPLPTTPINERRISSAIASNIPITPKPAFDQMRTPELRKALSDYGVRRLPKKKAIQLLNHIYDELHPYVEAPSVLDGDASDFKPSEVLICDPLAGVDSDEIGTIPKPVCDPLTSTTDQGASGANSDPSQKAVDDTLRTRVWECLRSDDQLYFNIVTYVPLELDCIKAMLRDAGINIGLRRLSEMLDSWGVTFTTRSRHAPKPGANTSDPRAANYLW